MGRSKFNLVAILFVMLFFLTNVSYVVAQNIDPTLRAYLDTQNQKTIAQINSKIDTQINRIEANLQDNVEGSRNVIIDEMSKQVAGSLKSVAIGLAGMIIITLTIFKIIDMKLSATKTMQKYERELKMKTEEFNKLITDIQKERGELQIARQQLIDYQNKLNQWEQSISVKEMQLQQAGQQSEFAQQQAETPPQYQSQQNQFTQPIQQPMSNFNLKPNQPKKEGFFKKNWKKILIGFLVLIIFGILGGIYYKFVILG